MTIEPDKREIDRLDALLDEVAGQKAAPSADLMARVLADAARVQLPVAARPLAQGSSGVFSPLWAALGGWAGAGGLAAVAAAGVWLGIAPPAALESVTYIFFGNSVTLQVFSADDVLGVGI
jgi:hypothetical protein